MYIAPPHITGFQDVLLEYIDFNEVKFLCPNTTLLRQPSDQQDISNFKKLYTSVLFQLRTETTGGTNLTLRGFWKN